MDPKVSESSENNPPNIPKYVGRLILIRGPSGVGKSTYAKYNGQKKQSEENLTVAWHEADHFFIDQYGEYCFYPFLLPDAHLECQNNVEDAMKLKIKLILVSNTFCKYWELRAYLQLANKYNYKVWIEDMYNDLKLSVDELVKRSVHRVPRKIIQESIEKRDQIGSGWLCPEERGSLHQIILKSIKEMTK